MRYLLISLIVVCLCGALAEAELRLQIAYEDKLQFPYYMGHGTAVLAQNPGVAVELIQRLEHHLPDLKIVLVRYPWKRCLSELQAGYIDGVFNASFHPKRLAIGKYPWKHGAVDVSRRITTISYSLYKLHDSDLHWNGQRFVNLKGALGVPLGYSIARDLRDLNVLLEESGATMSNLNKLLMGRLTGAVLQEVTADYYLDTRPQTYRTIMKVTPPIKTKPYYLMLSHVFVTQHPNLAETIWDTIKMLRETELSTIAAKYIR